jgi:hypothetical protein
MQEFRVSISHPDTAEPSTGRSSRRTRNIVIAVVVALVLVGGVLIVAGRSGGDRAGTLTSAGLQCSTRSATSTQTVSWTDDQDRTGGTFTVMGTAGTQASVTQTVAGGVAGTTYSSAFTSKKSATWTFTVTFSSGVIGRSPINYGSVTCA